jgi:hypothetical protein
MRTKGSRLRWWLAPITFAFGSLVLDATIVATDYLARSRIASAAPQPSPAPRTCGQAERGDCSPGP